MVNTLKMAQSQAILGLLQQGWTHRRIARELGVNRETVSRYAKSLNATSKPPISTPGPERDPESKPAISTPGSGAAPESKPAISTPGSGASSRGPGRRSACETFDAVIQEKCTLGLSAQRIFQDLVADHGFPGSYSSVKRYVRLIEKKRPLPFRRMETDPGAEAQVDFGEGWWLRDAGHRRKVYVLRVVLSYSRKGYSEAVRHQTAEEFIRLLENAFRAFGGCPKTLVPDYVVHHIIGIMFSSPLCSIPLTPPFPS